MAKLSKAERARAMDRAIERLRERLAGAQDGWLFGQIAEQVADRRRELGLSQAELAKVCGTTQSAIARLESGADALDCDLHVELRPLTPPEGTEPA